MSKTATPKAGPQSLCSQLAFKYKEPLHGTAAHFRALILLEYNAHWEERVVKKGHIPAAVRIHLETWLKQTPASRICFIKRGKPKTGPLQCYLINPAPGQQAMKALELDQYEALLDIDLEAEFKKLTESKNAASGEKLQAEPLYLICTHASRDRCCGIYGLPLYRELLKRYPDQTWQISHIGGHRWAPNLVIMPHGMYHGYVYPETLDPILEATQAGKIHLETLRGFTAQTKAEQAAEIFVRQHAGLTDLIPFQEINLEAREDSWQAHVTDYQGQQWDLEMGTTLQSPPRITSCGKDKAESPKTITLKTIQKTGTMPVLP